VVCFVVVVVECNVVVVVGVMTGGICGTTEAFGGGFVGAATCCRRY